MSIQLALEDLTGLSGQSQDLRAEALTQAEAEQSFDLVRGPLLRVRLLHLATERATLLLTVHHIIADGWSIGILAEELTAFYQAFHDGIERRLRPLPIQFADYAVWKAGQAEQRLADANPSEARADRTYWSAKLAGLPPCEIAPDFPRPAIATGNGHILSKLLPEELTERLATLAHDSGTTLFAAALAALKLLIHRTTGGSDIYVGTLVAGAIR